MSARKVEKLIEPIDAPFEKVVSRLVGGEAEHPFLEVPDKFPHSPLRYPGGKNRAIKAIVSCIPANETKLCSPFLGGGSIELACTPKMQVYGYDVFSPLVDFWQVLIDDRNTLALSLIHI